MSMHRRDAIKNAQPAESPAVEFIKRLVGAWDCCGTCAGGVLAERERSIVATARAKALREAADALGTGPTMRVLVERESCDWWTDRPVANWLRARAAREATS